MAKDRETKDDFNEAYQQAWPSFGTWQTEAKKDIQAYLLRPNPQYSNL